MKYKGILFEDEKAIVERWQNSEGIQCIVVSSPKACVKVRITPKGFMPAGDIKHYPNCNDLLFETYRLRKQLKEKE